MNTVVVVAVHPDDETLGCGGTLLRHKQQGDKIIWVICTETDRAKPFYNIRKDEIQQVSLMYEFDEVYELGLQSTQLDKYPMGEIIGLISSIFLKVKPNIVYLPFKGDVHSDHRIIFDAAYSCTKSFRYPSIKRILMIETLSETEFAPSTKEDSFIPNYFVNISDHMDHKLNIMQIFRSEIAPHPFPRSERNLRALGTLRGATAGVEYAESFMLLKEII